MGIEINAYAAELARVTIWIGEIQWMLNHGFALPARPDPAPARPHRDAATRCWTSPTRRTRARRSGRRPSSSSATRRSWAASCMRRGLGDDYVEHAVRRLRGRLPAIADLVLLLAREGAGRDRSRSDPARRAAGDAGDPRRREPAGARADQGVGRHLLRPLGRPVGPGRGATSTSASSARTTAPRRERELDGQPVADINAEPDRRRRPDAGAAPRARTSASRSWATRRAAHSTSTRSHGRGLLASPNPDGRSNADVVRPWVNGCDITGRPSDMWIIDFGVDMPEAEAALYEAPFEYVRRARPADARPDERRCRVRGAMVAPRATRGRRCARRSPDVARYIATPAMSKHRLFVVGSPPHVLPDSALVVFARDDDYTFGVLHSRVHEVWARAHRDPAARGRVRLPLHPHDLLRDLPVPAPHRRAARGHRRGRPRARPPPRRLAQPARPRPRRAR